MPYVNVPNDLSKIKTKIAFNLTKRQLICFGMGAAIGVPTYGNVTIPFVDRFPRGEIYDLLTTRPEDFAHERTDE